MIKLALSSFLLSLNIYAKPIIIAVIDTGIKPEITEGLCKYGHKDFTGEGLRDLHGHGTNISGIIHREAKNAKYCQVIIKYYSNVATGLQNLERSKKAFQYALNLNVDIINFSSYGEVPDSEERLLIKKILDKQITIVVPSGNKRKDLDLNCDVFPTCYDDRLIIVGRSDPFVVDQGFGKRVRFKENGYLQEGHGIKMSGTSQATAIKSGKTVLERHNNGLKR